MFWKYFLQNVVILACICVVMHFLTAWFRLQYNVDSKVQ